MLQLYALAQFAILLALLITLIKVARTKSQPRIKMILTTLYSISLMLYLDDSRGMDLADKHGLSGDEPLILGSMQLPVQAGILFAILGLQIYFLMQLRKQHTR
jgi:hypothetical protein